MDGFKAELSNLILRYTVNPPRDNEEQAPIRFTNQQILDAVRDTLCVTLKMNMQNSENKSTGLTTPVNEIVVTTPHAPDIVRVDYPRDYQENNPSQERNEQNELRNVYPKSPYPSPVSTDDEMRISDNESSLDKADGEKMEKDHEFVSADEVFKSRRDSLTEIQKKLDMIQEDMTPKNETKNNMDLYEMVEDAHRGAVKVLENLENLRQFLMPEPRPIRRLSAMMCLPHNPKQPQLSHHQQRRLSLGNNSSLRTIQLSKALRRSVNNQESDDPSTTPTTSRPLNVQQASTSTAHNPPPAKKPANLPKTPGVSKLGQSAAAAAGVGGNAGAAGRAGVGVAPVVRVNPRYAHVQSTIPKPISASKRKAQ